MQRQNEDLCLVMVFLLPCPFLDMKHHTSFLVTKAHRATNTVLKRNYQANFQHVKMLSPHQRKCLG